MVDTRGSWDFLRIIFTITIPIVLLIIFGGILIIFDGEITGYISFYIGLTGVVIMIPLVVYKLLSKNTGCENCIYNTEDKFLRQFE